MNIVIQASDNLVEKMRLHYQESIDSSSNIPYTKFVASANDTKVIAYETNKVMFQGKEADKQAALWSESTITNKSETAYHNDCLLATIQCEHVGSDEVGTGDYFGPVVVCASYVNQDLISKVAHLNIKDSKELSDQEIVKIATELVKVIPHYVYVLNNKKYNEACANNNANAIKAKMHNYSLIQLLKRINKKPKIIIDQFCTPKNYYEYLREVPTIIDDVDFVTKAENKYLAVAISAIIARSTFLNELEKINEKYQIIILKGASNLVDEQAAFLVKKYGMSILDEVAKTHFKNTLKVKNILNNQEEL